MESSIQITEVTDESGWTVLLKITGTFSVGKAREAAYEWCEEHNCLIGEVNPDNEELGKSGVPVFYADVATDDYQ